MYSLSLIGIKILLKILLEVSIIQAIVVERNYYYYYKLPVNLALTNNLDNATQAYFILQCPKYPTNDIPTPKDMKICAIVGKYLGKDAFGYEKITSVLYTKVDYKLKPNNNTQKDYQSNRLPYAIVIQPIKLAKLYKERQKNQTRSANFDDITVPKEPSKSSYVDAYIKDGGTPLLRDLTQTVDKSFLSQISDEDMLSEINQTRGKDTSLKQIPLDKNLEDVLPVSPLKYLSVQDVIQKLFQNKIKKYQIDDLKNSTAIDNFFENHKSYNKGEKSKGFQTMYHRDEVFNDHIFYDDLTENGNYDLKGQNHESL
ncbi:uncharacterized protein LOC119675893 [Teleopsis dalmanni]|uniref:uncharacterized protein LOC119675893 n=1 Tax=Teleopsis dalmanni TaxID=139649 RepID=UPI0018CCF4A6|nr:uncharacterized protein LOC119675893 [Teleopsis dalmanni]